MRSFLADIPLFVEVAKRKSFTMAADFLDIPLPTISRRIAKLERALGAKLLNRNSRKVEMTEAGKGFYDRCAFILTEAENAKEQVAQSQDALTGRIRLSMTPTLYFICMQGALCAFTEKYPGIDMHVNLSLQRADYCGDDCDLGIWSGILPDSSLKVRKLLSSQMGLYATPDFFEQRHLPQSPQDLHREKFIQIKGFFEHSLELCKDGQKEKVAITPKHVVNSMGVSVEFLMAGQGIAVLHEQLAYRYERLGRLIRILPGWTCLGFETYLLRPEGLTPRRIQIFMDHLVKFFQALRSPRKAGQLSCQNNEQVPALLRCHESGHPGRSPVKG